MLENHKEYLVALANRDEIKLVKVLKTMPLIELEMLVWCLESNVETLNKYIEMRKEIES